MFWSEDLEMERIMGLGKDECVQLQGDVEVELKCRKMCVCVCVSCYSTVLLTAGHTNSFSTWLTLLSVDRNTCNIHPT